MNSKTLTFDTWLPDRGKIVIFDLECTSWEGFMGHESDFPGKHHEVIQIGAVKLDCQNAFNEIDCFDKLVKPSINPELSDYIQTLTGLSQQQIDEQGISFPQALSAFTTFCEDARYVCSNGADDLVIVENCELNEIDLPPIFENCLNLRPQFSIALGLTDPVINEPVINYCKYGINSSDLTAYLGLPTVGEHHDGLTDARAVAAALQHLTATGHFLSPGGRWSEAPPPPLPAN